MNTNNLSTVYAMLLPDAITVKVRYTHDSMSVKTYTYKALKSWGLQVGDSAVVKTPNGELKVVEVAEVDDFLDFEPGKNYKWIVQRVDLTDFERLLEKEKDVGRHLQLKQRERDRQELMRQLLGSYEDENKLRLELGLPTINADPVADVQRHYNEDLSVENFDTPGPAAPGTAPWEI